MSESIDNPILNSPYAQPDRYYEIGPNGPTGEIKDGRRPSESLIPIAMAKKGKDAGQEAFDFDATGERRERNKLINEIRRDVAKWRSRRSVRRRHADHPQVAPALGRPGSREPRASSRSARRPRRRSSSPRSRAGTTAYADWRRRLEPENEAHNDGLPRVGPEDGDRSRQDRRDGDAHRLADPQQGAVAARRPIHQPVPRRHARASRSATGFACFCRRMPRTTTTCAT